MELWTSTTLPPPLLPGEDPDEDETTAVSTQVGRPGQGNVPNAISIAQGCELGGEMYMDGMQVY